MGTTTFYLRHNDSGSKLSKMKKKELEILDNLSPYKEDLYAFGWRAPLEVHNGNIYVLVFWKGKLMKLEDAPKILKNKYYDKYRGKTRKEYEWTLLRRMIISEIDYLDKDFKKELKKKKEKI